MCVSTQNKVLLYIFWFLHQTTTNIAYYFWYISCISFDSYIKPQRAARRWNWCASCISFDSYIKPQLCFLLRMTPNVVYLLIPTSNHNYIGLLASRIELYIFWFLHQTTTRSGTACRRSRLYIFWFLHQTTTPGIAFMTDCSCISFDSYIKPQPWCCYIEGISVVYLLIPTSNHNLQLLIYNTCALYIFWFLHQTTTWHSTESRCGSCISFDSYIKPQHCSCSMPNCIGCISFDSYIKPQPIDWRAVPRARCISFDSYIKPQPLLPGAAPWMVVYLLIPTSNHNYCIVIDDGGEVVYLLIPTSNHNLQTSFSLPTTLYIFWFLHQTTTSLWAYLVHLGCISFDSYIKPQHTLFITFAYYVVYLLIPTSNHNVSQTQSGQIPLYIFWFLHQTTTGRMSPIRERVLYIFWFLHQTTTLSLEVLYHFGCISFDSYIKPQLMTLFLVFCRCCISFDSYIKPQPHGHHTPTYRVVYLLIPTSNHNLFILLLLWVMLYIFWFLHQTTTCSSIARMLHGCISFDSYIKPQLRSAWAVCKLVVYLLIPTSNHNLLPYLKRQNQLYIFWFLHQTTTPLPVYYGIVRCISFDSYIKPQPAINRLMYVNVVYLLIPTSNHNMWSIRPTRKRVVYLLIPTSNHNCKRWYVFRTLLYIFWFLHQTTTLSPARFFCARCISFDSYIKPQQRKAHHLYIHCCISFDSYIKPQLCPSCSLSKKVVYLLIPTSNHNIKFYAPFNTLLYIFWFLHQTTTFDFSGLASAGLYIFWFLHQTTTYIFMHPLKL